ncbi:hypothetical protein GF342_02490 [Candidatus Woesearchaeota archaeon]|nr:hypothetical protein [Candidatus Woesearchaeota archaeon]
MPLQEPESMDDCVYFTKRVIDGNTIKAWVYKGKCPKCAKALMGKPVDEKTGKVKIRAKDYVCPSCGYTVAKEQYEETLFCEIKYKCPTCKAEGETSVPFKRKKVSRFDEEKQKRVSVDAIRFECGSCGAKIDITKKMK